MNQRVFAILCAVALMIQIGVQAQADPGDEAACRALARVRNLTILSAELLEADGSAPRQCYVRGLISPAIQYHVQLPLPDQWNGRFLSWGDGGKDGDLDFAHHRVAQGYAVANSNSGHDSGSEPGSSFGFHNRQAEIDFGYRAVHVTANAAKTVVEAYYARPPAYSYHEGCSTGGRQGLMEAQRFPDDFDGIVAGDPVNHYQALNISHVWKLQRVFQNDFAGMLAYDAEGDGVFESLTKLRRVHETVLEKCDAVDGIRDGVIDDPQQCGFDPERDLAHVMCPGDANSSECLTRAQLQTVKDFYAGPYDSQGMSILRGKSFGSELDWAGRYIPHPGNSGSPSQIRVSGDHINFLYYEEDPGIPPSDLQDLSHRVDGQGELPEWAWWNFNIDDFTAGRGALMSSIMDAVDPDLESFLADNGGKLILYHGWADPSPPPLATIDYYQEVARTNFSGDMSRTRDHARLFMIPGMGHCRGGPGPNEWDKLAPLVEWVEQGKAPDHLVAVHRTDGAVDNERKICAYPQQAVYTGPPEGRNDPVNWIQENFTCR